MGSRTLSERPLFAMYTEVIKRNRAVTALYAFLLFIAGPFSSYIQMSNESGMYSSINYGPGYFLGLVLASMIATAAAATVVTRFLHSRNALDSYYALPVRRGQMFAAHVLGGLTCLLVPIIMNFLLQLGAAFLFPSFIEKVFVTESLLFLFDLCVLAAASFSLVIFVSVQVGRRFEVFLFGSVINFLFQILVGMSLLVFQIALYGFAEGDLITGILRYSSPFVLIVTILNLTVSNYLASDLMTVPYTIPVLVWLAVTVALLFWSCRIFNRRKAEISGTHQPSTIIAYLIKGTLTFGGGVMMVILGLQTGKSPFLPAVLFLIGAIPAFAATEALLAGGFKGILRKWAQFAVISLCGISVVICSYTGGLGYVKRIPKAQDVQGVYVNIYDFMPKSCSASPNAPDFAAVDDIFASYMILLSEPDSIDAVIGLHTALINGYENRISGTYSAYPEICYRMKDGSTFKRSYTTSTYIREEDYESYLEGAGKEADLVVNPIYRLTTEDMFVRLLDRYGNYTLVADNFYTDSLPGFDEEGYPSDFMAYMAEVNVRLLQALREDMQQETMSQRLRPQQGRLCVLHITGRNIEWDISVFPWHTRTLALLEELCPDYAGYDPALYPVAYVFSADSPQMTCGFIRWPRDTYRMSPAI